MPEFIIREASDEDGATLAESLKTSWAAYGGCALGAADQPPLEAPASHFAGRGGRLWIVVRDGQPVGSLGVVRHVRPGEFELMMIGLDETCRGQGLAAAMFAGANAFAAASDGRRLNLWIDARLVDGVRFAERHGFVRDPGLRARHDGSDALEHHFSREVEPGAIPLPSEDRPAAAG